MANLKQKTKLLKLLKGLNKDDFLEAEIIDGIINELENIKASMPQEQNLSPYFEAVNILEKEYSTISTSVKGLSQSLSIAADEFQRFGKITDERLMSLSKETSQVIKGLKDELEKTQTQVLELKGRGGGSQPIKLSNNGTVFSKRYADVNFKPGSNITITTADNNTTRQVDVTLNSSGGSGSGYQLPLTGGLNQKTFTWTTAPSVIVVDGIPLQATRTDGTVNWTGTTTTVLTIAPSFDIFSSA